MCLITTQKKAIILKEDLVVYKTLGAGLISVIHEFQYKIGELVERKIKESVDPMYADAVAYNYYQTILGIPSLCKAYGRGLHFMVSIERIKKLEPVSWKEIIVKCIIPKGAEIYYDKTGLGITNKLTVIKTIK